jgi:glycosyltransferase involved in cell wall biosynthesis
LNPPLLTVVTVTFNAGDAFLRTLESVRTQTVRSQIEYLVVDGASSDGTREAIQRAANDGEVDSWKSEPDRGIYDAMNKAASVARGCYTLFLNAGDVFPAVDTLEKFLKIGDSRPSFLWGDSEIDRKGRLIPDPAAHALRFLYREMMVSHQSLAVGTDLLRAQPFDLAFRVAADHDQLCALVASGHQGLYQPVVVSRTLDEGFSSRNFFLGLAEKRQISRRYFPGDQWRAVPYFALLDIYMKLKIWYKERS